jgi:hypothetical protein
MTNRSDMAERRRVQPRASRALLFWTMAVLCSLSAAGPTHAMGCHAQERPVLHGTLSWDMDQRTQPGTVPVAEQLMVLTHPRCGDETPLASGSSVLPVSVALLNGSNFTATDFREALLLEPRREHLQPTSIQPDRPPRWICAL